MSSVPPTDVAYRVLRLEQRLDSYQHLHAQELQEIRQALEELKALVLALAQEQNKSEEKNQVV